jgi:hypothetical protein
MVKYLLVLALQSGFYDVRSQSQSFDNLVKNFNGQRVNNLQEKLYVHTDQALYLTGETLWLKAYCVDGTFHTPIDISKVAYLELLNADNQPVLHSKIALTHGTGSGAIFLPATLASGNYTLRAYTQWMKNFKPEFFFHKTLAIINTFKTIETPAVVAIAPPLAQFFPEGGTMISGLKTKVAFQVTDSEGTGIAFKGFLLTEKNDTIVHFQPEKFGIGSFYYTPVTGSRYRATILEPGGRKTNFELSEPTTAGYSLHVEEGSDEIKISLQHSFPGQKKVYLFIHSRQQISTAQLCVIERETVITFKKTSLFTGISHITLFDEAMQPVCERLYFNGPGNQLKIGRISGESEFGIRKKVSLDFIVSDPGKASPVSLSVAVVKKDSLTSRSGNIVSFLDFESDLKGRIESPEYYTNSTDAQVSKAIDNLMLTHGWRRFTWADIKDNVNASHPFIPEYRGHFIYGKVIDPSGNPVAGIESYLSAPGKNIQFSVARSNGRGEVRFEMKNLFGEKKLIAQTNLHKDSLLTIKIDNPFSNQFETRKLPLLRLLPALENQLLRRSVGMQVQDVFYKERNERFTASEIDSTAFYGEADESYLLDDYTRFPAMEEVLREYVKGVFVRKTKGIYYFNMWDRTHNIISHEEPLILLDGIPVFDVNKAILFDPLKLQRLDLVTRKYFMGHLTFHGIISFQTYSGDLADFQLDRRAVVLDYKGLQFHQEFYSPQYETPVKRASRLPDRRNLLYWSPTIIPGSDGKLTVEFYTGDMAGEYSVTIEGITDNGTAGSHTSSFFVKK